MSKPTKSEIETAVAHAEQLLARIKSGRGVTEAMLDARDDATVLVQSWSICRHNAPGQARSEAWQTICAMVPGGVGT